jgi:predicted dehydrogenase
MSKKRILLVGCGQLGSRHLQAVASLPEVYEIQVVDPNAGSLALGQTRLKEVPDLNREIKFSWLPGLEKASHGGDLCILPTQARGRGELIKKIAKELGYKRFLVEKIVTQSMREYYDLMGFSKEQDLSIWVDCQTRTYEIHRRIKAQLDPQEPIVFGDFGGNHGLACNGIHYADLFLFYDNAKKIKSAGSRIDPILHKTKRGKDIFDLSGTLLGGSDKGSTCIISYSARHLSPDYVSIQTSRGKYIVDHIRQVAFESLAAEDWQWKPIELKENYRISHLSKGFVSKILNDQDPLLPTLEECRASHEYILGELLPHFNRLLKVEQGICPVT